jgi:hypothetical protein
MELETQEDEVGLAISTHPKPKYPLFYISMKFIGKITHSCMIDGGDFPNIMLKIVMEQLSLTCTCWVCVIFFACVCVGVSDSRTALDFEEVYVKTREGALDNSKEGLQVFSWHYQLWIVLVRKARKVGMCLTYLEEKSVG